MGLTPERRSVQADHGAAVGARPRYSLHSTAMEVSASRTRTPLAGPPSSGSARACMRTSGAFIAGLLRGLMAQAHRKAEELLGSDQGCGGGRKRQVSVLEKEGIGVVYGCLRVTFRVQTAAWRASRVHANADGSLSWAGEMHVQELYANVKKTSSLYFGTWGRRPVEARPFGAPLPASQSSIVLL